VTGDGWEMDGCRTSVIHIVVTCRNLCGLSTFLVACMSAVVLREELKGRYFLRASLVVRRDALNSGVTEVRALKQ
jgi:hypothetical protein